MRFSPSLPCFARASGAASVSIALRYLSGCVTSGPSTTIRKLVAAATAPASVCA